MLPDQKRFYTRGTLTSIRIPRLAKNQTLCRLSGLPESLEKKEMVNYLSCIEGKGVGKHINCSA